jgi:myo-inositol 2-dehydrogenase/D-chiro-inositol 1-dehydrogenase
MPSEAINFGLLGYGLFGKHHANAISSTPGARLAAIAVKSEASQQAARDDHPDADVRGDWRELIARDDVEVVDVVVPNRMHYEVTKAALEAGKHVLLEKPMAVELAHCDELVALAEEKQRVLAINHELRLSSLWAGVKRLIDEGAIGQPLHALIELSRFPYRQGAEGWRYDADRVGSWILEEPIHFFDLARWYLSAAGEPESLYARANSRDPSRPRLFDNFSAIVNFPGGAYAVVSQTLAAFGHHVTAKITGSDGAIWAHWSAADARSDAPTFGLRYGLGDDVQEVTFDKSTGELLELADQIAAMVCSVREGASPPCSGNDGRWSTLLCLAAEQSVKSEAPVDLRQFARTAGILPVDVNEPN